MRPLALREAIRSSAYSYTDERNRRIHPFSGIFVDVPTPVKNDFLDFAGSRESYEHQKVQVTYAPVASAQKRGSSGTEPLLAKIRREERFGSLVAAAGTIWAVYVGTHDYASLMRLQFSPPGPLEVCALGILIWLHAKWRRSLRRV